LRVALSFENASHLFSVQAVNHFAGLAVMPPLEEKQRIVMGGTVTA